MHTIYSTVQYSIGMYMKVVVQYSTTFSISIDMYMKIVVQYYI